MPTDPGKIEVLIVEDDVFLRKILATKFEKEGFAVRTASNGEEALTLLHESAPAMMLLDLIIPKVSGFDVLADVRATEGLKDLPVVVLSNLSQEEDIKRVTELGALGFMSKADNSINEIVAHVKEEFAKIAK
ncbi:MAG: response regulator [Patescibacteria group bacterium]